MLEILYSNGLRETITAPDQDSVEVVGYLEGGKDVFRFRAAVTAAVGRMARITETIRARGAAIAGAAAPEETLLAVASASGRETLSLAGRDLRRLPDLTQGLLDLDRGGRLAPTSISRWIRAAEGRMAAGGFAEAFRCAASALDRGYLPYIRILAKDDTSMKRRAAIVTFDGGRKAEGVEIMIRLAQNRMSLIEKAWKD